jgi:hypothetical protein
MPDLIPDPISDTLVRQVIDYAAYLVKQSNPKVTVHEEAEQSFQRLISLRRCGDEGTAPLDVVMSDLTWKRLLRLPEKPLDLNFDLMAAENYAFARKVAIEFGDPHTEATVRTYYGIKTIALAVPLGIGERFLRTSKNHPVLPESDASKRWASTGVFVGLGQYKEEHNGQLGAPYSSRGVITANASSQYKTGLGTTYGKGPAKK